MIVDDKNRQMLIEPRDLNYILPAYIRTYLFYAKNEMPDRILFPMLHSVSFGSIQVPIEWVPEISPVVDEIVREGSIVPEVTAEQEAALDEKDEEIKRLKIQMAELKSEAESRRETGMLPSTKKAAEKSDTTKTDTSTLAGRKPKLPPGGDIGPGLSLSDMRGRDRGDQKRTRMDLAESPDVDESAEVPFDKEIRRDETGKPIVE